MRKDDVPACGTGLGDGTPAAACVLPSSPCWRFDRSLAGMRYGRAGGGEQAKTPERATVVPAAAKRVRAKNDPKLVAAARELRDRWMERVNSGECDALTAGKYDVGRVMLPEPVARAMPLLPAA